MVLPGATEFIVIAAVTAGPVVVLFMMLYAARRRTLMQLQASRVPGHTEAGAPPGKVRLNTLGEGQ